MTRAALVGMSALLAGCGVIERARLEADAARAATAAVEPMMVTASLSSGRDSLLLSLSSPRDAVVRDSASLATTANLAACAAVGAAPTASITVVVLVVWQPAAGDEAVPLAFSLNTLDLGTRCATFSRDSQRQRTSP